MISLGQKIIQTSFTIYQSWRKMVENFNSPLTSNRSDHGSQSDGRGDATRGTLPTP